MQLEDLAQVGSGADDRADDRDPVEDGLEDRQRDLVVRRQGDEDERAAAAQGAVRLLERRRRHGERDRLVGTAELLDRRHRVLAGRVDCELCAELASELELLVDEIDCDHASAGDRRVLDREVAEPADAEDGDEVRRACARDLDCLVGRDAGAGQRRRVERVELVRHLHDVARIRRRVLAEAAVDRVAHVLLLEAERLPAGDAVVARPARVAEPWHRDAVADSDLGHSYPELLDDPDALVSGHEWRRRLDRPVAVRRVDVGVTKTGRLDPNPDLTRLERESSDLLDRERLVEVANDRCAVRPCGGVGSGRLHLGDGHDVPPI